MCVHGERERGREREREWNIYIYIYMTEHVSFKGFYRFERDDLQCATETKKKKGIDGKCVQQIEIEQYHHVYYTSNIYKDSTL